MRPAHQYFKFAMAASVVFMASAQISTGNEFRRGYAAGYADGYAAGEAAGNQPVSGGGTQMIRPCPIKSRFSWSPESRRGESGVQVGGGNYDLQPFQDFLDANQDVDFYALQVMRADQTFMPSKVMAPVSGALDIESVTGNDVLRSFLHDPEVMQACGVEILLVEAAQLVADATAPVPGWSTYNSGGLGLSGVAIDPGIFQQIMEGMQVDPRAKVELYATDAFTFQDQ